MGNGEARPHWKDEDKCSLCKVEIGFFTRHHCRNCGRSFCGSCSNFMYPVIQHYDGKERKRVCKYCYDYLSRYGASQITKNDKKKYKKNMGLQDFELLTMIGTGKFGKVVKVLEKATGKIYAMKVINKKKIVDGDEVQHTISERNILMKIKHPFLMKLRYAFQTTEKLILVMDFINGGELFYHLQLQPGRRFSNERARFYAAEICLGIEHLHVMGIIYRDLKPENVLVDAEGHIRLTDFGLSKEGVRTKTFCGTPEYLAPEVLEGKAYSNAVDWWGFGALIYEMLTGWAPFYEKNVQKMYQLKITRKIGVPEYVDAQAKDLLIRLLDRNPKTRLTDPKKIKGHNWFSTIDWDKLYNKEIEPPYKPKMTTQDSIENIDPLFTKKDVSAEIGSVDEIGIDDNTDPKFTDYTYFPERDPADIETGSWPPTGKSSGFECLANEDEVYEPSKSQPNSFVYTNPAERILEAHGLGRVPRSAITDTLYDGLGNENDD